MHHIPWITLHVSDIENSLAFYRDILGMEVVSAVDGPATIRFMKTDNDLLLELIRIEGETVETPGKGISFGLETENIPSLVTKLKENGIPVSDPMSPNPMFRFYFLQDPDGYNIQLVERLTPCQHS
ncbi:MAG: VOC family protein [Firmicutes bacterium]|nr:VOC family protein [Bacillota bacterium]